MSSSASGGGQFSDLSARLADAWARLLDRRDDPGAANTEAVQRAATATAPVVWMLGKVQSGKSSIVEAITGASQAEVGSGFRACTRTASVYDYPPEAPVVRFLDTRGLGEAGYTPDEDMAVAESKAHLVMVVARAMDLQQQPIVEVVATVRSRHPDWPVIVAQTALHEAYLPGAGHGHPYPFDADGRPSGAVPERLARALAYQRALFDRVGGSGPLRFVPIDFVRADDVDLVPRRYGIEALLAAIEAVAPAAIRASLAELQAEDRRGRARRLGPLIMSHAAVAAATDAVPVAGAVAVPGVQARLLYVLATESGIEWDRRLLGEFGACLGASVVARIAAGFGLRQLVKLVPVYGQTIGAAAAAATSFATTYALGHAALVFLDQRLSGRSDDAAVADEFRTRLAKAFDLARERGLGAASPGSGATHEKR